MVVGAHTLLLRPEGTLSLPGQPPRLPPDLRAPPTMLPPSDAARSLLALKVDPQGRVRGVRG